ncbi:ABC transporter substrate-binding protein [Phaeobacter sp. HS012]|uniref:ABC transporter substrate-binding protein n=1 Tax=Phaeobacter TaxID=302485 RepID=UPI000C9C4AF1|nr:MULTISPECIES: ABC transporter substrate-binding protein [Phaeobacter]AUQ66511.1 putative periplasmic dipeptide transport protein [Phaeobacter inhibens]MBQ4806962.1 ABC transporter substrate-binding protein [Phaeobacter sp. HS012]MBQ4881812.1 ABC transporter substrate-binding protein [Phaeobacter sp. HS011]UWR81844.1 ABC transporter substrate-binding protein [Phaeobacter inhibens]
MKTIQTLLGTAALGLAIGLTPMATMAETPANMLVIANRIDDITTLDPAQSFEFAGADVIRNIYGKLVNFDPSDLDAGYQPDLAESWTVSEDGRTITFTMRDGVTFQSGNPVRAEDAAFSLKRAVLLNKTPSFIITQFGFTPENVDDTIKVDGNTLSITTDKRYATSFVLNCLTATIGAIVDKELVMANEVDGDMGNKWLTTNSAGSGPYSLASWKPKESVTLSASPSYYGGEAAMKRVIVRHVQESATQRLMLERGDIDVARDLTPSDVDGLEGVDGVEVLREMRGRLMYVSFNQKHPELSKPQVRQALKYLIDYDGMENSFLKNWYVGHQNFLPKTYLGAVDENPFSFDVEKAKALLAEAGVENLELTVGVREAQERLEIAQSLQNTFAQAGITLNLEVGTGKQILGKYRARELDIYLGAWGPDYPDPHTNAGTFAYNPDNSDEANATGLLAWRNGWDTGGLTEKVAAAVVEGDTEKRAEMYHEIQAQFRDTAPFAVMFQLIEQAGMADNVEGLSLGGAITSAAYWDVTK